MRVVTNVVYMSGTGDTYDIAHAVTRAHEELLQRFDWVNQVTGFTIPADEGFFIVFTGLGKLRTDES